MDPLIARALAITPSSSARARTVDITTTGARTGQSRRIEVWFYRVSGEIYLTSGPGRRDWYANLIATPSLTLHLKHGVRADLPALARPVTDVEERRTVLSAVVDDLNQPANPAGIPQPVAPLESWVAASPLAHLTFLETP